MTVISAASAPIAARAMSVRTARPEILVRGSAELAKESPCRSQPRAFGPPPARGQLSGRAKSRACVRALAAVGPSARPPLGPFTRPLSLGHVPGAVRRQV